jgi:hypothetical protein
MTSRISHSVTMKLIRVAVLLTSLLLSILPRDCYADLAKPTSPGCGEPRLDIKEKFELGGLKAITESNEIRLEGVIISGEDLVELLSRFPDRVVLEKCVIRGGFNLEKLKRRDSPESAKQLIDTTLPHDVQVTIRESLDSPRFIVTPSLIVQNSIVEKDSNGHSIRAGSTVFQRGLVLRSCQVDGDVDLRDVVFEESAILEKTCFEGRVDIGYTSVIGNLDCNRTIFKSDLFCGNSIVTRASDFRVSGLEGKSNDFSESFFGGGIRLTASNIVGETSFEHAVFGND